MQRFFYIPKDDDEENSKLRRLWLLEGVLEHSFNEESLMKIVKDFERIGLVPSGYDYPQLRTIQETKVKKIII